MSKTDRKTRASLRLSVILSAVLALTGLQLAFASSAFANTGTIGDRVWEDRNGNGIQDPGEPGVEGVYVALKQGEAGEIHRVATDANGNYQFTGVEPGQYSITFHSLPVNARFTTQYSGEDPTIDSNADGLTGNTEEFEVAANQNRTDIDAGIFYLPNTSVGDRVWYDTDGNGVQDDGEPGVPGITVVLYDRNGNELQRQRTDRDGRYLFEDLPPTNYVIGFEGLPANRSFTKPGVGGNSEVDSDPDPESGLTHEITLEDDDMTIDAGLIAGRR